MAKPDVVVGAPLADFTKRTTGEFIGNRGWAMAEVLAQPTKIELNPKKEPIGFMPPREHTMLISFEELQKLEQHAIVIIDLTRHIGFVAPHDKRN